jgi:hypothetical protein
MSFTNSGRNAIIPHPKQELVTVIMACWAELHCADFLQKKKNKASQTRTLMHPHQPHHSKYVHFCTLNGYTVLGYLMLPASAAVELVTTCIPLYAFRFILPIYLITVHHRQG